MQFQYPQTGFHFAVTFELFPQMPSDIRFQEVSGLKATVETGPAYKVDGNATVPQLPVKVNYENLVLKRGVFVGSGIRLWCIKAIEEFEFHPTNLTVMLLDETHMPVMSWYVVGAYPVTWEVSAFNAERSEIVVESITLNYDHFKTVSLESAIGAVSQAVTFGKNNLL